MENTKDLLFKELISGHLERVLTWLPREQWFDTDVLTLSFNHDGNAKALARLVVSGGPLVLPRWTKKDTTLLHLAKGCVLEELCRVAPSLQFKDGKKQTPLQAAIDYRNFGNAAILMTYGARLSTIPSNLIAQIPPKLWALEKAILRCRASTIALLRLKRTGKMDYRWDKYLMAQIAHVVWESRRDDAWISRFDALQLKICTDSKKKMKQLNAELDRLNKIVVEATSKLIDK